VHQLHDRPLAEGMLDELRAPALLEEQPLEEIRGSDHFAMAERKLHMCDAQKVEASTGSPAA